MSLESNKTLGGIGAILLAIPFLNLIGIILVLIALKGMSEYYNDEEIFKNAIYGFIFGVVGVIALIAFILMLVFGFAAISPIVAPLAGWGLLIITVIILYAFSLLAAIFYKKSLDTLSEKSGEQMFNTAGLILLIGAAIPVVGEILKFIAWILAAVGFFGIKMSTQPPALAVKPEPEPTPAPAPAAEPEPTPAPAPAAEPEPTPAPAPKEKRFCQYCGAQIQSDAIFCSNCGKKIK